MLENQRCIFKIEIFHEMEVAQKTIMINLEYMCYVIASTF